LRKLSLCKTVGVMEVIAKICLLWEGCGRRESSKARCRREGGAKLRLHACLSTAKMRLGASINANLCLCTSFISD
jgi:hypothetical protein